MQDTRKTSQTGLAELVASYARRGAAGWRLDVKVAPRRNQLVPRRDRADNVVDVRFCTGQDRVGVNAAAEVIDVLVTQKSGIKHFPYFKTKIIQLFINLNTFIFIVAPNEIFRKSTPTRSHCIIN